MVEEVTKRDSICFGNAREPSHQPIIQADLPFFAKLEEQRSGEGLRDAVRKERWLLVQFWDWDPVRVRFGSGFLDNGHARGAAAARRRGQHLRHLSQGFTVFVLDHPTLKVDVRKAFYAR